MPFGFGKKAASEPREIDLGPFLEALPRDAEPVPLAGWTSGDTEALLGRDVPAFTAFMAEHAGASFGGGQLRFLGQAGRPSIRDWNAETGWRADWPSMPRATAFASDWLGRLYLFDPKRLRNGEPRIGLLDPASGEYEVIDRPFEDFLVDILVEEGRQLLDSDRLAEWISSGGRVPAPDECVAFTVPLILGGEREPSNMEVTSLVVWVSLSGQIYEQTKDLPPGTEITGLTLNEP